jgi:hypothetical protein
MARIAKPRPCRTFVDKTYTSNLYKWSPPCQTFTPNEGKYNTRKKTNIPYYCDATAGSQGQDWITNYVYTLSVSPIGEQERLAYVECDYVE